VRKGFWKKTVKVGKISAAHERPGRTTIPYVIFHFGSKVCQKLAGARANPCSVLNRSAAILPKKK
jgi:hypothetical protein